MKFRKITLLAIYLLTVTTVFAQDYTFRVLANKGANEIKSGDTWQPLKTGVTLKESDELKLSDNAYLGLVHVTGKPLEVKEPGNHKVLDLVKRIKPGNSALGKYTEFILSNNAEAKKNRLSATGAVHRGTAEDLQLLLPETQNTGVYNSSAIVSWEETKVAGPYTVTLLNMFDEEVTKSETPETSYRIDMTNPKLQELTAFFVVVASKSDPKQVSKKYLIKKLSPAERENVKKKFETIASDVSEPTAMTKLMMAGFYEENKLVIDAITAYTEAIQLAPDVPTFKESFEEFLLRQGIKQPK